MANVKVVPNRAGYKELLDSAAVQSYCQGRADAIAQSANSKLDPNDGYEYDGFEVKKWQGKLTTGYVIRTKTDHARASQNKNNTLLNSLDAGR